MPEVRSNRWIKFHVKALDNPIFTAMAPAVAKVFMITLARANWAPSKWWDGQKEITIPRGSFIMSTAKLAEEFGLSRQQVRDAYENLRKLRIATITGTSRWSMVTVLNYDTYQGADDDAEPAVEPTKNQRWNQQRTTVLESVEVVEEHSGLVFGDSSLCTSSEVQSDGLLFDAEPMNGKTAKWGPVQAGRIFDTEFWPNVWAKIAVGKARPAFIRQATSPELAEQIVAAAKAQGPRLLREAAERAARSGEAASPLHPATWLNAKRYLDQAPVNGAKAPSTMSSLAGLRVEY